MLIFRHIGPGIVYPEIPGIVLGNVILLPGASNGRFCALDRAGVAKHMVIASAYNPVAFKHDEILFTHCFVLSAGLGPPAGLSV